MHGSTVTHIHLFGVVLNACSVSCLSNCHERAILVIFVSLRQGIGKSFFTSPQNSEGNRKIFGGSIVKNEKMNLSRIFEFPR